MYKVQVNKLDSNNKEGNMEELNSNDDINTVVMSKTQHPESPKFNSQDKENEAPNYSVFNNKNNSTQNNTEYNDLSIPLAKISLKNDAENKTSMIKKKKSFERENEFQKPLEEISKLSSLVLLCPELLTNLI